METAHTNTHKPADSARPLTIDTNSLRDLWLPCEQQEREALAYMQNLCMKSVGKKNFAHLNLASTTLKFEYRKTVHQITKLGGLLLIGGAK